MATNSLSGVNLTRISQLTLDSLKTMPIPFSAFTTDFSADIADSGSAVTTRFVTNPTVQNFAAGKSSQNSTTTSRTISLSYYKGVDLGFADTEVAFSDVKLMEMFIRPSLVALFEQVMTDAIWPLVVNANFQQNAIIAAANFNAANVALLAQNLNTAKVPLANRSIIIPPSYAVTLKKDTALQASYAYGNNQVITSGQVPRVYGFDVYEYNGTIPNNSENLGAVALAPQAIALATRVPRVPRNWFGQVMNITEPNSGLTVQLRDYYDGVEQRTQFCLIYGAQYGVTGNLYRIPTA